MKKELSSKHNLHVQFAKAHHTPAGDRYLYRSARETLKKRLLVPRIRTFMMSYTPYNYVRWTWWKNYEIHELTSKLKEQFIIIMLRQPDLKGESLRLSIRDTPQIEVKADTLSAYLAPAKAVLFQKKSAPFTKKDLELRKMLLTMYPHSIPMPIPVYYRREPKFQTEEKH